MNLECDLCGTLHHRDEGRRIMGYGRLCPDCDERADVVTDWKGEYISMSVPPKEEPEA